MDEPACPGCRALAHEVAQLRAQLAELTRRLEDAQRAGKRQAAPFRKGPPKPNPNTPGRKPGDAHGKHGHRPPPEGPFHETLEAELPACCPHCFGGLVETEVQQQTQLDLPRAPIRRRIRIHCGQCRVCGRTVRGHHPQQTSGATGAAAHQVGPDAQAAVVLLNKECGLSHGKVARVMTALLGVPLTRGASAQIVLRAGRRLEPVYQTILAQLPHHDWLSVDETGWRLGGHPAWLHVWVGTQATAYAIDPKRDAGRLERVIGPDWSGTLVHDGWSSYDRFSAAVHQQCVAHVLVRARQMEEQAVGRAKVFPRQVIALLRGALAARDAAAAGRLDGAGRLAAHEHGVGALLDLTERPRSNGPNEALAKHLYAHGEQWLMFLLDPSVPATNWPAEQATRPAVVNRKVWGGNRTPAGAHAQEVTMSVLATCRQHGVMALDSISAALRGVVRRLFPSPLVVASANQ